MAARLAPVSSPQPAAPDFDLTDAELRRTRSIKWTYPWTAPGHAGGHPGGHRDVLPAWVAEMDVRPCPPVAAALHEAVDRGVLGYPAPDGATGVPEATAAVLARRFGQVVDPARVVLAGDVMAAVRLVLETLCEPAPVVVPLPSYPPFLQVAPLTGRELRFVATGTNGGGLDLDALDAAFAAGARTLLLSSPHNPTGRVWSRAELEAVRDLAVGYGARVISDEVHALLTLPGARHTPYAELDGTADHVTTVTSASKAFNLPGVKCAQIVAGSDADLRALRAAPLVANHGLSPLGAVATVAAYTDGDAWLDALLGELQQRTHRFAAVLADRLPGLTWAPPQATYLAWLDLAPYLAGLGTEAGGVGGADRADRADRAERDAAALVLRRSGLALGRGADFGPGRGFPGHVRVTLATSAERLDRIVERLVTALPDATGGAAAIG